MEGGLVDRIAAPEMLQKHQPLSFLGRRSFAPRPLSEATEIFDTDIEDDDADDSPSSLDSQSTLSSLNEATTPPPSGGLGGYHFHFDDKPVAGPYGPHLFMGPEKQSFEEAHIFPATSPVPDIPQPTSRPIATLNTAVAELDEAQVRSWSPHQVADWMNDAGFEAAIVEKFLIHDIYGEVLLDLQFEDLKELDISSFGKRRQVMTSIQQLRESTYISSPVSRKTSVSRTSRSQSRRRGRHTPVQADVITPAESVSIVAIEQVLPKPHTCSKGENCPKWKKQQRKIQRLEEQFAADIKSIGVPSVVGSSDVLGPSRGLNITSERLSAVEQRDPLDNVRNFLNFQHINSPTTIGPAAPAPAQFTQHLNGLPKLTIPTENKDSESPFHTPISALRNPTEYQAKLRADLLEDPYHYGGVASPVDVYRLGTPMSATDIPVTALAVDPCQRDASHSVPPEMRYGAPPAVIGESMSRQASARHPRRPSFAPHMTTVRENINSPSFPPVTSEAELANHNGWMRKRKTTRLMKHEWQDNYYTLSGTQLGMHKDEASVEETLQSIDVDEYTLHAYATASSSKLSAAFKKSIGSGIPAEPTFAFSLIPEDQKSKKLFEKDRSHHFAVNSGKDRVDWMRKLMLAKAMKKNDGQI